MEIDLSITENTSEENLEIIKKYWEMKNDKFINPPKKVAEIYNITLRQLNTIIANFSVLSVKTTTCEDCKKDILFSYYSQSSFKESWRRRGERCDSCKEAYFQSIRNPKPFNFEKNKIEFMQEAFNKETWKHLSEEELNILIKLIRIKDKGRITKGVYAGEYGTPGCWKIINALDKKNLMWIKRDANQKIISFYFLPELENELTKEKVDETISVSDSISFSLAKYLNRTKSTQPHFSGTFIPKTDIVLKAGTKYLYGGWELSDSSINLKIQPSEKIKPMIQETIENESIGIKKIVEDWLNEIPKSLENIEDNISPF